MEIRFDEKNLFEDLEADTDLQQMMKLGPQGKAHVDHWVSYYACQYTDAIGTTDARVYEILEAIISGGQIHIEIEGAEDPYPTKRDFDLSFEHAYDRSKA
jgi:hypothetical protein